MTQKTDRQQAVARLLSAYGDDVDAAMAAVADYRENQKRIKRTAYAPEGRPLIEIANVAKSYRVGSRRVDALRDVSLTIHEGEFVAITGASGSGKSTLLQLIGGLDRPTVGTVSIDGNSINAMKDGELSRFRNKTVGFVFQFFYLQPFLKIGTNIEVPSMFAHTASRDRHAKAQLLADQVGLADRLSHLPKELSGGQMQRAAIARALLNNPKVLLADEPTGNLDSANGAAILELFENIRKQYGTTVVVVTHDSAIAARADREISMKDGVVQI